MTCFFLFCFFHIWEIFFFFIHDTMYCAKWICAHTGSIMLLRTCKLLSIQQSKKRCFPMSLSSSSSWNIICHSDLHLQARNSFFECGLFPSRASISVMVWGVIWDKICKEQGRQSVSHAICHVWHFVLHRKQHIYLLEQLRIRMSGKIIDTGGKKGKEIYPEGTQVLKQLVCSRNTKKHWADSLTAQTPGWKKERKPVLEKTDFFVGIRSLATVFFFFSDTCLKANLNMYPKKVFRP